MSQPFHLPSSRSCFLPSSNEPQGPDQAFADHLSPGKALWLKEGSVRGWVDWEFGMNKYTLL